MENNSIPSEISWLSFNSCVLEEANDSRNALYERIKFLAIHSSNLDEFFRVKINRLIHEHSATTNALLSRILAEVNLQQNKFGNIWNTIVSELAENNIIVYENQEILSQHVTEIANYFKSIILSYIQVVYVAENKAKPYFLNNRGLYFLVKLKDKGGNCSYAYLNIPSDKLNRYKQLQPIGGTNYIISIDTIIKKCLSFIFPFEQVVSCNAVKINRDENYEIADESSGDLIAKIEAKVKERKLGYATRFLYDANMDPRTVLLCKKAFRLQETEMIEGGSHHNLFDLFKFPNPVKPMLQGENYPSLKHLPFEGTTSIFEIIEKQNQLIHFPYQSYHYVLQFFNQAAIHKDVTEIQITLYRLSSQSLIANALISAAKNGKKVTVFVEVKARFDEDNNLFWSKEMEKAGIKIIYSMPNLKVHAKVALVTMKNVEGEPTVFSYLSTGNFNETTAGIYSDFGFFTSSSEYTSDLKKVFSYLQTKEKTQVMTNLLVAGFNMKEKLIGLINNEIRNKKAGYEAQILIKVNGVGDKEIVNKLIQASQAGVEVILLVRGICTIIPGIKNFTENIKIYRIVDMFLEHARIYRFANGGEEILYLSSADMLSRNLNRRIEVAFPITDKNHRDDINRIIQLQLEDNTKKRTINSQGLNDPIKSSAKSQRRAQVETYHWIAQKNKV